MRNLSATFDLFLDLKFSHFFLNFHLHENSDIDKNAILIYQLKAFFNVLFEL